MRGVIIGTVCGACVLTGLSVSLTVPPMGPGSADPPPAASAPPPFLDPALLARAICGPGGEGQFRSRRAFFLSAASAYAATLQTPALLSEAAGENGTVPRFEGLGTATVPISTDSAEARALFDQGYRLTIAFNHTEAIRSFRAAQAADPDCALCYWGEALALGPNINAPMAAEAVEPAFAAITKAQSLAAGLPALERDLIGALATRYSATPIEDRSALDAAYADAMADLAQRYLENDEVQVLAAEAAMDTQPWDYWAPDGLTAKGRMDTAIAALERVLARNPDHPAAIHLYIHAVEASNDPYRAEAGADRLAAQMPGAGHIVHMPSHIYFLIGRYEDSLATNVKAVSADERYLASTEASPLYRYGYYPHNVHFVVTSAQMAGDKRLALAMASKLDQVMPLEMAALAGWIQPIKAAPLMAQLQFGDYDAVLAWEDPGADFPYLQAMRAYARGEAFARQGRVAKAKAELAVAERLRDDDAMAAMEAQGLPAPALAAIAAHLVRARIAMAEDKMPEAIAALDAAVAIQDALPYIEPPFWYYPVRQTLGAALLKAGQARRAEEVFMRALLDAPNNGWAYYGLAEAMKAQGNDPGADYARALMERAWAGAAPPSLDAL